MYALHICDNYLQSYYGIEVT